MRVGAQLTVSTEVTPVCPKGCELCSEYNGCLKCLPKLFILLERNDIRQIGICLPSCPVGYFGVRNPEMNKCTKCKIDNCEACFSRNFCTKCKEGLYLHKGRCYSSCPEGFAALNGTVECSSVVQCELGEWGSWGPCTKKGKLCGFKKGTQNRTRESLQPPLAEPSLCPPETENRMCTVQKKPCAKGVSDVMRATRKRATARGRKNAVKNDKLEAFFIDFDSEVKAIVEKLKSTASSLLKEADNFYNIAIIKLPVTTELGLSEVANNAAEVKKLPKSTQKANKKKLGTETISEEAENIPPIKTTTKKRSMYTVPLLAGFTDPDYLLPCW
ncbi:UNVERIFIED_CONTAM: hypothetical protein FKN15_068561 [Acipenser sinensis]